MAWQLGRIRPGDRILDPAIGSGVLVCALIERLITDGQPLEIWLDGYEIAWETEVWLAEIPEQLIHFNGDRFSGPHKQG
jgi:tRNA A58 N-methylase Trm61